MAAKQEEPWDERMGPRPVARSLPAALSEYWPLFCEHRPDGKKCEGFTRWRLRNEHNKEIYVCEGCVARPEFDSIPRKQRDLLKILATAE